ncbi:MAG: hypothetical protein IKZ98_01180 [Clostridia bacterium]|nr:hypothetical protein [Clostridia bacterium]
MNKNLNRILTEQKSKTNLSLLICLSLFIASVLLLVNGQMIGLVFLVMSLIIGTALLVRVRRAREELAKLGDNDEAGRKLDAGDAVHYPAFGLTIGPDFVVLEKPTLQVFLLGEMKKFEVGLAGDVRKVLFLTDRDGKRHPIAETRKEDDHQADFDRAYRQIRDIFSKGTNSEN